MNLKLINLKLMNLKLINLKSMNLKLINLKSMNLKLVVLLYFLVLFGTFWCLVFLCFFVLVKSYHKKNKKFKTDVITSFILLLTEGQFLCYVLGSIASQHLLVPNRCGGRKQNLTSSCLTAVMLAEELIELTLQKFCKNKSITPVKIFMK